MTAIELLNKLTENAIEHRCKAKESIKRNSHMNNCEFPDEINQNDIDAILVDFINKIASNYMIDYALCTDDLLNNRLFNNR